PECAAIVLAQLQREGVVIRRGVKVARVAQSGEAIHVTLEGEDEKPIEGSHLLVAAGRLPNIEGLDLEKAGIKYNSGGVAVDRGLRTSNRKTYAIGDVAGGPQFTHAANYHAGIVIRNALFRLPARANDETIPWVT